MLDLIEKYERFFKSFHISLYEQEGEMLRFKAQLTFTNESKLFIKEYVFKNKERKYAHHWTDISTSPHHKHTGNEVFESIETSVGDVLNRISEKLEDIPKY